VSDSGLPPGWAIATINDTGRYINGFAFKPSHWGEAGRPIIRIQNLTDEDKAFNRTTLEVDNDLTVRPGEILVSWSATLDAFIWKRETAVLNQHIFRVVPEPRLVHPTFLFHLLRRSIWQMKETEHLHGSTMKHINRGPFLAHVIKLPPLHEQTRIVEKHFTRLDAAVAAVKRVQANLKRYRAAVLKAACEGRLVPTEAELARKEGRSYETGEQLLARILKERRAKWEAAQLAKMQASGKPPNNDEWKKKYKEADKPDTATLPSLPKGWVWTSFGQVFGVFVGATPSRAKPEYWHGTIPWVSSGEVGFCRIQQTREQISDLGLANASTVLHPPGTVLLGMIGEGKTRGQAAILDISACNNQNSAAIRIAGTGIPAEYVYRYLEGQYERTRTLGSGNNQPALNRTRVEQMVFPLAPLSEQHRIVSELEGKLSLIDALKREAERALPHSDRLRQSILKRAFEGKLVPQDPHDEPASVLLERIRAERAGLKPQKKSARQKRTTATASA